MLVYSQFKTMSTGYIPDSHPPKFDDVYKHPIDLLGSDGKAILDGRGSLRSWIIDAKVMWNTHMHKNAIVGFEIIRASSFSDKGTVLYSSLEK